MNKALNIINKLKDKKLAILGFGREGISSYKFIRKYLPNQIITIIDLKDIRDKECLLGDTKVNFIIGEEYLNNLEIYDLIIKAPGVSLKDIDISKIRDKITSQMELMLEEYKNNVIGITGTKGKSTTASLLYEIFKNNNKEAYLVGNIGTPVLDELENFDDNSVLIAEMSSFQIEYLNVAPHIAVILNLYIDHLNHAGTIENYHNSKLNIFKKQTKEDIGIYISDTETLREKVEHNKYVHKEYTVSIDKNNKENNIYVQDNFVTYNNEKLYDVRSKRSLAGEHILKNIMCDLLISKLYNLDINTTIKTINEFKTLPHRMEYVGKFDNIKFYNDSIATIPEATMYTIKTIGDVDTLIVGGSDKGSNYDELINFLNKSNISNIICMPDTGLVIKNALKKLKTNKKLYYIEKLNEAVTLSKKITKKGLSCLMSPAAANFTEYNSYVEKGNAFKEFVKEGK